MEEDAKFSILDSVESTNNYAMGQAHEGLAKHGMAWFAKTQTAGKGQRGKTWLSDPASNIILTVILKPTPLNGPPTFVFNAVVTLICIKFLSSISGKDFKIKWPNDLYYGDRKAGGILIENVLHGKEWKWAVIGIGININQVTFPNHLHNPVSLKLITGLEYDPILLARKLHADLLETVNLIQNQTAEEILVKYNSLLYKKDQPVRLKKNNMVFSTTVKGADKFGNLITIDAMERIFAVGEVDWIF